MTDEEIDAAKVLNEIIERACKVFGKSKSIVHSKRKTYELTDVRWAIFRAAKAQGLRVYEIARKMNCTWGNVTHGCLRCQERIEEDKDYAAKVRALEAACENHE